MGGRVIDGKAIAADVRKEVASDVAALKAAHGLTPGLAVVLVGEDPASQVYVRNKGKQTVECGMQSFEHRLPEETSEADILALVAQLNNDPVVHGILVQLPLPKHVNSNKVLNTILPDKDVDGFHPVNVGRLSIGERALVPCTPVGSVILAKKVQQKLVRHERGCDWPLQHCWQTGCPITAERKLHSNDCPLTYPQHRQSR